MIILLIPIHTTNAVSLEDTFVYTDGTEIVEGYRLINDTNNNLINVSYYTDFLDFPTIGGNVTKINYYTLEGVPFGYDKLEYFNSSWAYLENRYENITIHNVTNTITYINSQNSYGKSYNKTMNFTSTNTRNDSLIFIGYGTYTVPETGEILDTIDVEFVKYWNTTNRRYVELNGATNYTAISTPHSYGVRLRNYTNGTLVNDAIHEIGNQYWYLQYAPAIERMVNETKINNPVKGVQIQQVGSEGNRHLLKYDVKNKIDWEPPKDNDNEQSDSTLPFMFSLIAIPIIAKYRR